MIKLKNITYKYGDYTAIENFSLEINQGEFLAVQGKNGSGKSTLALILTGILKDFEGEYLINGEKPEKEFLRKKVGIVFQDPENQLVSSVVKNDVAFGLENRSIDPSKMDEYIDEALESLGIFALKNFPVTSLSGGEKQKVAIAGIRVMNFDVFIFDEVTSMLDPESAKEVLEYIKWLNEQGKTIVMITHKTSEANMAQRVVRI